MYLYTITNLKNGKVYVGASAKRSPQAQFESFVLMAYKRSRFGIIFEEIRMFGPSAFSVDIIDNSISTEEELIKKQREYIDKYNSLLSGYNETYGNPIVKKKDGIDEDELYKKLDILSKQMGKNKKTKRILGADGKWKEVKK